MIILLLLIEKNNSNVIKYSDKIQEGVTDPTVYQKEGYYYLFTSQKVIKINEEDFTKESYEFGNAAYSTPHAFLIDQNNEIYFYSSLSYSKIELPNTLTAQEKPGTDYISNNYFGYIQESGTDLECNQYDCRCEIITNEIVLYGRSENENNNEMFLEFLKAKNSYTLTLDMAIQEKISCKQFANGFYICITLSVENVPYYYIIFYYYNQANCSIKKQTTASTNPVNIQSLTNEKVCHMTNMNLYDTNNNRIKLLCGKCINENLIQCMLIVINMDDSITGGSFSQRGISIIIYGDGVSKVLGIELNLDNNDDFDLSVIEVNKNYIQMLLCCDGTTKIRCVEIIIDKFKTFIYSGSYFDIEVSSSSSVISIFPYQIFYNIFILTDNSLYLYSIYKRSIKCNNYTSDSLLENQSIQISPGHLMPNKTQDEQYYIVFEPLPDNDGKLFIKDEEITETYNTVLVNEEFSYKIIPSNNNILKEFKIFYHVQTSEGNISEQCHINSTFYPPCYESCKTCIIGKETSDISNHHCVECKTNYYPFIGSESNCYNESQKESNWYFDNDNKKFLYCNGLCASCNGPNSDNCLSCESSKNLYNNQCLDNCPQGTYRSLQTGGYYACENCYKNCLTCSGEGNRDNMNCVRCEEGDIKANNYNCYKVYNSTLKTFYDPDNINIITSCKELLNQYILIDSNECIDSIPSEEYYFENATTGLLAPCHSDCKTCSKKANSTNTNCDTCKENDLFLLNGNCVDNCPDGYYSIVSEGIKKCEKCYENCKTCSNQKTVINDIISSNCLSCDITKNLYLVNELNNCEPESFINEGYYLKELEDNPDILIFYKCYISCSLCDMGLEFDTLTNKQIHHCLECAENYYALNHDEYSNNCYNEEEMIPKGYILLNNIWEKCHENCDTCFLSASYDLNNQIISQNCLTCYGNLNFIYNTSDCGNNSLLENGYYFDDNDFKYHKCNIQCKSCEKYSNSEDPKCIKCNTEQGYYLSYNKPLSLCFNSDTKDPKYGLYEEEDDISGEKIKKWMPCYELCDTCIIVGNEIENNCLTCKTGYYLINTGNCVTKEYALNNGYYFDSENNELLPCDEACITCHNGLIGTNTNCYSCNETFGYYNKKGENNSLCYNNITIGEGYFLNKSEMPFLWEECYENCATCTSKGNINKMNCLSCKNNYIENKYNKSVYLKLSKKNCIIGCPPNLFLTKELDCVSSCLNNTYKYFPNYTCLDTCPDSFIIDEENISCIFSEFKNNTSISDFKEIIYSNITSFIDSSSILEFSNFKALIMPSININPAEQLKKGISGLDLHDCIQKLKNKYNIPENEDLIVVQTEEKLNETNNNEQINLNTNIKITITDISGNILDMSLCNNDIIVFKYIEDKENIIMDKAREYAEKGVDIYNPEDPFFNDKCHKIDIDMDITIKDRREDIFENVSFCEDNCKYNGMDYVLNAAICSCDAEMLQDDNDNDNHNDEKLNVNNMIKAFTSELLSFNFDVMKCINLVFDNKILIKNIGFYTYIIMIITQICILVFFLLKKITPIRVFIVNIINSNPQRK